jgi:hypothetical protein
MADDVLTVNGVPISGAAVAEFVVDKTVVLADGRVAEIRKGKGKDAIRVMARVMNESKNGAPDSARMMFVLTAELTRIGGQQITIEDLEEMDLGDALKLMGEALGANFTVPLPATSQS